MSIAEPNGGKALFAVAKRCPTWSDRLIYVSLCVCFITL